MGTLKRAFANNIRTDGKPLSLEPTTVTAHSPETDLTPVRQDVLTLALKQAVQENHTKYNLPNSSICKFGAGVGTLAASATGTALGTTNVPSSAVTDVSGVILLKDAYGSTTLGTDVKAYFTADNSNWTEADSYADAGTFSTGIKMIKLGKATCTSGSDVRWKIVWANQVASSKEAQIYGIGLNY